MARMNTTLQVDGPSRCRPMASSPSSAVLDDTKIYNTWSSPPRQPVRSTSSELPQGAAVMGMDNNNTTINIKPQQADVAAGGCWFDYCRDDDPVKQPIRRNDDDYENETYALVNGGGIHEDSDVQLQQQQHHQHHQRWSYQHSTSSCSSLSSSTPSSPPQKPPQRATESDPMALPQRIASPTRCTTTGTTSGTISNTTVSWTAVPPFIVKTNFGNCEEERTKQKPRRQVSFDGFMSEQKKDGSTPKRSSSFEGNIIPGILKKPQQQTKGDDDNNENGRRKPPQRRVSFEDSLFPSHSPKKQKGENSVWEKFGSSSSSDNNNGARVPWWKRRLLTKKEEEEEDDSKSKTKKKKVRGVKKRASRGRKQPVSMRKGSSDPSLSSLGGKDGMLSSSSSYETECRTTTTTTMTTTMKDNTMKRNHSTSNLSSHQADGGGSQEECTKGNDIINLVKMLAEKAVFTIKQTEQQISSQADEISVIHS